MMIKLCGGGDISSVRHRIKQLMQHEWNSGKRRHIVVLAVDGIPASLGYGAWKSAVEIRELTSLFPTTSFTCWTSSYTGQSVQEHGIVGVVFKPNASQMAVNLFTHPEDLCLNWKGNLFSDAVSSGYKPVAVESDLSGLRCGWKESLLRSAERVNSTCFFSDREPNSTNVTDVAALLKENIWSLLESKKVPTLLWLFVDIDQWIHKIGYSEEVELFLSLIDEVGAECAEKGCIMIAHSDHGLVETINDPQISKVFDSTALEFGASFGGAGRVRWVYSATEASYVSRFLSERLPDDVLVCRREEMFINSPALIEERVGDVLLIAQGRNFITPPGYSNDHGSLMPQELSVPYARWEK